MKEMRIIYTKVESLVKKSFSFCSSNDENLAKYKKKHNGKNCENPSFGLFLFGIAVHN